MRFIQTIIATKKVYTIVDIGTYKIRCNIIEIGKSGIRILGYGEKKQEAADFYLGTMKDIAHISKSLKIAITKAEKEAKEQTANIIVNSSTTKVFFLDEICHYTRQGGKLIKKGELKQILLQLLFDLKSRDRPLQSGAYWTKNMKMLLGNIHSVKIDNHLVSDLISHDGKAIDIAMSQFFMEVGGYDVLKKIVTNAGKEIGLVLPYENSVKDLVNALSDEKDYVVINIGNNKTTIVIVRNEEIIAMNDFHIGIGELIEEITRIYKITNIKAIKTIDVETNYEKEKQDFYNVWEGALKITLEDTIGNMVCPNSFFMFGGGYNKFIEKNIEKISFNNSRIKMKQPLVLKKIDNSRKDFLCGRFQLDVKSNISLLSMVVSMQKYYQGSENEMIFLLQKLLKKN